MRSKSLPLFQARLSQGAQTLVGRRELARYGLALTYFLGMIYWELRETHRSDILGMAISALTVIYLALLLSNYFWRGPAMPLRRGDWFAQMVALLGANLLIPLSYLPVRNPAVEMPAAVASIAGLGISIWAVWHLGRSFTIVPEARQLVESGPYRWVRHPLYLGGFSIGVGILLVNLSSAALGLFLAFAGSQALRIAYEEEILGKAFPEFQAYRRRTWALLPHVY